MPKRRKRFLKKGIFLVSLFFAVTGLAAVYAVKNEIAGWSIVPNISPQSLARELAIRQKDIVLFDVRTEAEFLGGHLANAIRVDPAIKDEAFLRRYGDRLAGKTVVFYCRTGVRSTRLAYRIEENLKRMRLAEFYNLAGGAYRWKAEGNPIVKADVDE